MGIELAQAYVSIKGDASGFKKSVDKQKPAVQKSIGDLASSLKGILAGVGAAFSIGAMLGNMKESIGLAEIQINAEQRLTSAIKARGAAAGVTAKEMIAWASQLQSVTTFGDEETIAAASRLMAFQSQTGDTLKRTMKAAMDLSAGGFGPLKNMSLLLAKSLEDPIVGMTALNKAGVVFNDTEKKRIRQLVESNQLGQAQDMILAQAEAKMKGVAEAMADTPVGRLQQAQNTLGDIKEEAGKLLIPLATGFTQLKIAAQKSMNTIYSVIAPVITAVMEFNERTDGSITLLASVTLGIYALGAAVKFLRSGMIKLAVVNAIAFAPFFLIAAVVAGIVLLVRKIWSMEKVQKTVANISKKLGYIWQNLKEVGMALWNAFLSAAKSVANFIGDVLGVDMADLGDSFAEIVTGMVDRFADFVLELTDYMVVIAENWDLVWGNMGKIMQLALDEMSNGYLDWIDEAQIRLAEFFAYVAGYETEDIRADHDAEARKAKAEAEAILRQLKAAVEERRRQREQDEKDKDKGPEDKPPEAPEPPAVQAVVVKAIIDDKRLGFADLGRKMQEAMLDAEQDKRQAEIVRLLANQLRAQERIADAMENQEIDDPPFLV